MKVYIKKLQQNGLVAIVVTLLIMFLVSIVVLAFTQLVRREQRQALDRQLSTQAFYTAESGVNGAIRALENGYSQDIADCDPSAVNSALPGSNYIDAAARNISGDDVFKVTCILINQNSEKLVYDSISNFSGKIIPVQRKAGIVGLASVNIFWNDVGATTATFFGCPSSPVFPSTLTNCNAPGLRIDFIEKGTSNVLTLFVLPRRTPPVNPAIPNSVTVTPPDNGSIVQANCNAAMSERFCGISLNLGLLLLGPDKEYALRIVPIYKPAAVTINGTTLSLGGAISFKGAQAVVDVTAKGNDVLRRLQAYVPIDGAYGYPEAAVFTTEDICKQLQVGPPGVSSSFGPAGCPSY